MNSSQKSVSEYFAGIGLVRIGLERAGWQVQYANDISVDKHEMYSAYFEDAEQHYVVDDIFDLSVDSIPTTQLATASFPCIDLSVAGNQKGINGQHSSAFWGFIEILDGLSYRRPPLILLENVPGWITSNDGQDFRLTIKALNDLGYACDVFVLDAIRFTPQSRPRVFITGFLTNFPNSNVFELLRRPDSLSSKALKRTVQSNFDLKWHTSLVPEPPLEKQTALSNVIEKMTDNDERWWSLEDVERHLEMMSNLHRERVDALLDNPFHSFRTMYRRVRKGKQRAEVRNDESAGCLRTARGGSSKQMLVRVGCGEVKMRHLTPREYARLQGTPDTYPLPSNINQALTGFGDAVCVPVVTWIGENVLNTLYDEYLRKHQLAPINLH